MEAAQRLYAKVTKISPRFIYGWSNLGNAQVALGILDPADEAYSTAINLCQESLKETENTFGVRKCDDLYILLLNRGSLRLNNRRVKDALSDLTRASKLRGKPDGIIAQNLARAEELNGLYAAADRNYALAISMTSNEVNPFWLRSALVKLQIGDVKGGFDLLKRVDNRFPEAPEVRAAYATFLAVTGEQIAAQRKYLEIPDIQRLKYINDDYLKNVIAWPPAAIEGLAKVTSVVEKPKSS
jgi:tetratricopeptide (TPR) repeat protein